MKENSKFKMQNAKLKFLLIVFFLFLIPFESGATILSLESKEKSQYLTDEEIIVKIKIDPEKETINLARIEINFDNQFLELKEFNKDFSIFTFWLKEIDIVKTNQTGKISFVGAIPNGFQGIFLKTALEADLLAELSFKVKKPFLNLQNFLRFNDNCQVFLNDGWGREDQIKTELRFSEKEESTDLFFGSGILYNGISWKVEKI